MSHGLRASSLVRGGNGLLFWALVRVGFGQRYADPSSSDYRGAPIRWAWLGYLDCEGCTQFRDSVLS